MASAMATPLMTMVIVVMFVATTPMSVVVILAIVHHGCACNGCHCWVGGQGHFQQVCVVAGSVYIVFKIVCSP